MNKFKKLAVAVVSITMAGTMGIGLTACGGGPVIDDNSGNKSGLDYNVLNADGTINYNTYKARDNVTLNLAVGHEKTITSTSFKDAGDITLPDGVNYAKDDMKPAWVQMGKDLNVTWNDKWEGNKTSANLGSLTGTNDSETGKPKYDGIDIFTSDLSVVVSQVTSGTAKVLNLADYLNVMPNFKKFLNNNPIVYLSLLQDGMDTTNGKGQTIYVAPYFDGYNDIERYCIIRQDWAKKLLNGNEATGSVATYASECAQSTSAVSFMGKANYSVDALTKDGSGTQKITKDYVKALAAAKDESKALGAAYKAIAGKAYAGDSGNIVDIMNAALAENNGANGAQLVNLFRAYIDVAFTKDGNPYFNAANRADLFCGYEACWDVDDLVAMLRCVNTNASLLVGDKVKIHGIAPRSGQNDRTPDMVSLACQLYGVRGGTSRNEYTYIDNAGNVKDARADKNFYEAMAKMHALRAENLIDNYEGKADFTTASGIGTKKTENNEYFMVYDYSQTQTLAGFVAEGNGLVTHADFKSVPDGYDFAPIITPVSKWDVNGDGSIAADEYFRFTESWRSTKVSGLGLNAALEEDKNKLTAALQFIDYLYSEDGQIVSTFGPMAENADGKGGFWYNSKQNAPTESPKNYFTYKGVKYAGTEYKGAITPTITDKLLKSFKGETVNGFKLTSVSAIASAQLSFTNYARYLIGSTLPLGVKSQSFENQLTSEMGKRGANVVGVALDKKVIKGMSLDIDPNNYWYTCVPTSLPVSDSFQNILDGTDQTPFMYLTGKQKDNKNFFSIMNNIILYGTSATYNQQGVELVYASIDEILSGKIGQGADTIRALAERRANIYNQAWTTAKEYWNYLKSVK